VGPRNNPLLLSDSDQACPLAFAHAGLRIVVVHFDASAATQAASGLFDVVVFGHTHKPLVESRDGVLRVNPGETGGWLSGKSTVALLDPAARTAEIVLL
jgi:putative phosphoesterase